MSQFSLPVRKARPWAVLGLGLFIFICTPFLLAAANGNIVAGLAPILALGFAYGLWKLPLRTSALGLLFLVLSSEYIFEAPFEGLWSSPFAPVGQLLFLNLSAVTGIPAFRLPAVDFLIFAMLIIHGYRRATGSTIDGPGVPNARVLNELLFISLATVIALEVWGMLRGGDFNESLWQLRQLLLLPLIAFLFMGALRGDHSDYRAIMRVCITAALIKAVESIFFYWAIVRPGGHDPEFATSHSDTLNYVLILMVTVALLFELPTKRNFFWAFTWVPVVYYGMLINDRRLAYVSMMMCFVTLMMVMPRNNAKRTILRSLIILSPLILAYTAAGWNSLNPVFGGAQLIKSLIYGDPSQAGADYRDIENYDLLGTWDEYPIIGSGFGHKFEEPIKLPDISFAMPTYQYHPHNSLLWLWGIGGALGFTGLWMWLVGAILLAARSYRHATHPWDRVAALGVVFMALIHLNQCFADMGTRTYFGSFLMGLAAAVVSQLAVRTGAWPAPTNRPVNEKESTALAVIPPGTPEAAAAAQSQA